MNVITAIGRDFIRYFTPTSRAGLIRLVVLLVVLFGAYTLLTRNGDTEAAPLDTRTMVRVGSVTSLNLVDSFSIVGTVESQSQAAIQSEAGGRVTSVPVVLGQELRAGQVIATLENSAQSAALLQAQGSYDAAVAAARLSDLGTDQAATGVTTALNDATTAYRSAYTTASDLVLNSLDQFYSNGVSGIIGFKLTSSDSAYYNSERLALRTVLAEWERTSAVPLTEATVSTELQSAIGTVNRLASLVAGMVAITADAATSDTLSGQPVRSYNADLLANQATLNALLSSLRSAETGYQNAVKARQQAELAGTGGTTSSADAQVKIALGSLRAAEAAYAKTIIRTPISGTLNELTVQTGDYISPAARVALVANNEALMVTAYVGESDRERLTLDQTVTLDDGVEGTIVAIAPAVDTVTKKTEIKIASESTAIQTGDTVTVHIDAITPAATVQVLRVPLEAVKFTATEASMYVVVDGKLEAVSVEVGTVSGDTVEVTSGIDSTTEFVLDARGLTAGQSVEVIG